MSKFKKSTKYKGEEVKVNRIICMWDFWAGKVGKVNSHVLLIIKSKFEGRIHFEKYCQEESRIMHITRKEF